ncbi:MAG TPA: DUF4349 domain-containing protein [Anaerolineaceae bacterium]|nr:DUF4349 domain-containing protein [Anaerolineaceae bacterium]HPN52324.1 DUF4349 domain-containing protein [Anaerolineaceae bacterium]
MRRHLISILVLLSLLLALPGAAQAAPPAETLIVRNISLNMVVTDPSSTVDALDALVKGAGGRVDYRTTYEAYYLGDRYNHGQMTLLLPDAAYETLYSQIKAVGQVVGEENTSSEITAQWVDARSQAAFLQGHVDQLERMLASAASTEEKLRVTNDLKDAREALRQQQAVVQSMEDQAAFVTVKLVLRAVEPLPKPTARPREWDPAIPARQASEARDYFFRFMAEGGIWGGVYCLPLLLICLGPVVIIILLVRHFKRKKPGPAAPPEKNV